MQRGKQKEFLRWKKIRRPKFRVRVARKKIISSSIFSLDSQQNVGLKDRKLVQQRFCYSTECLAFRLEGTRAFRDVKQIIGVDVLNDSVRSQKPDR